MPLRARKTLIAALLTLELVRVKTEEKLRRRCLGPQMKTSARHPESYGYPEPWISAVLRLPNCQQQPTRRAGETPPRGNQHSVCGAGAGSPASRGGEPERRWRS